MEKVAIFGLSLQFAGIFNLFESALGNALLPHYYETSNSIDGNRKSGELVLRIILFFGILLNLIYLLIKPLFFMVVKDINYYDAIEYVPFLLFVFYLRGIGNVLRLGLLFSKKTKIISLIKGCFLLVLLFSSIYLIKKYNNILGVAFAYLISNFLYIIVMFIFSNKYFRLILNWKKTIFILFYTCILFYFFINHSLNNVLFDFLIKVSVLSITSITIIKIFKFKLKFK